MTKQRVTRAFPGRTQPVYPGVYQRLIGGHWRFAYWSERSKLWFQSALTAETAASAATVASNPESPWRGLAEDPSREGT